MKVLSSDRRSSKSRSKKSIEFSSKNQTKIIEKSGLCPYLTKNASERASRILRDAPVARPCGQTVPRGRPGSALGAPWSAPRASRSPPEASPNRPGTPQIAQDAPRIDFSSVLGSILGRPGGSRESPGTTFSLVLRRSYCARGVTSMMLRAPLNPRKMCVCDRLAVALLLRTTSPPHDATHTQAQHTLLQGKCT